jgi:long-subunit fatty acid transport protein
LTRDTPGEPGTDGDARAMAMGGAVLGLADGSNGNLVNPAIPATFGHAYFGINFERNYIDYKVPYGKSVSISYDIPRVWLSIPFLYNTAISVSLNERYDQNYEVGAPLYVNGAYAGVQRIVGEGAVYSVAGGLSAKLNEKLYVGLAGHYNFGAPRQLWQNDYYIKGFSDTEITIESRVSGFVIAAGLAYRINDEISVGGFAEIPSTLKVNERTYTEYGDIEEHDHEFNLPIRGGTGFAYKPLNNLVTVADVKYTRWSGFGVNGSGFDKFRDTIEIRGGAEYRPSLDKRAFVLWRTPYRAGVFYEPWYDTSRGEAARIGASAGLGYVFNNNENSRLDLTFEYSHRGGLDKNGVEENIFNLYMSLVGIEAWLGKSHDE